MMYEEKNGKGGGYNYDLKPTISYNGPKDYKISNVSL